MYTIIMIIIDTCQKHEAWNCNATTSELKVLRKPISTNMVIAAHAIRVRTTMPSLVLILKVSQVFNSQDKHNASLSSNMSRIGRANPIAKIIKTMIIALPD